jgi:5-oxoprolinase (ATP-hydrolysing)
MDKLSKSKQWQFWIDRGGTFTDVVALNSDDEIIVAKLLSENLQNYEDASLAAIKQIMGLKPNASINSNSINVVKMGTTIATNALLTRKGARTVLAITKGFADAICIGYQNRPDIFALQINLPEMLYENVIEVEERILTNGKVFLPLNIEKAYKDLEKAFEKGCKSIAIVLMHGYRYHEHEKKVAEMAKAIGYEQISISHEIGSLIKLIRRGDTTLADAYLSPVLKKYIKSLNTELKQTSLMFMQSNGGLVNAKQFAGKDSILSGPAGGIIAAIKTSRDLNLDKIITFDMGGTSTDVAQYSGELERNIETTISGVRLSSPMLAVHTVAAGGGSVLHFDGYRYRVGPQSAGANPGPACYRKGGPLTITDANVMLGRIQADFFPHVFGIDNNQSIDLSIVQKKFDELSRIIQLQAGHTCSPEEVAFGYLTIAVSKMANAIKQVSVQKGHDVTNYTLYCFGGAAGQHACLIAEQLGIKQIVIHPYAGVLSALGMGLADISAIKEETVEELFVDDITTKLATQIKDLEEKAINAIECQAKINMPIITKMYLRMRYQGSDFSISVKYDSFKNMIDAFEESHKKLYGFISEDKPIIITAIIAEAIVETKLPSLALRKTSNIDKQVVKTIKMYSNNKWFEALAYNANSLIANQEIIGPVLITDDISTTVVEYGWAAKKNEQGYLFLYPQEKNKLHNIDLSKNDKVDPVLLELFNNLFMFIAEQMGIVLQNTSHSVNVKERLDFSCAIFDSHGDLIANAPHMPVHLGSMGESVQSVINLRGHRLAKGDVYMLNDPYNGGTHLPDITVITPIFVDDKAKPSFFVASRAHHADIGGITPGSMPSASQIIEEEGVLIPVTQIVSDGVFHEQAIRSLFMQSRPPVRNCDQNIADLKAQIAANNCGVNELNKLIKEYSLTVVEKYMGFVQDNAEKCVRRIIGGLKDGSFICQMDDRLEISVEIKIDRDKEEAIIDFSRTSIQSQNNFNAPLSVCKAAVLYVFRTLVKDDIPLNAGCMRPLKIIVPKGSLLNPAYPAAVVAGNVETSQIIVDALYGALKIMAASQGTMNNFTFGNDKYQYYETICGGSGAGKDFSGTDAVHTHMTNSRLTDPEVLETRYPVLLEEFSIRKNSGGLGNYSGGNGTIRKLRFLEAMQVSILSGRRKIPPHGLNGGKAALLGVNYIRHPNGNITELNGRATIDVKVDDVVVIETPGGGGYGNS